ncbi:MAG: hypothetical protein E6G66_18315 [Actinobacteria bacterium]|nr:MAG: hypothetical protein E6G66_18315 [Actinomycetota bacterium]
MAVAVMVDIHGGAKRQYEQIVATIFPEGKLPEGWLLHLAGPSESGWRIVNVVPSQEQFEVFAREQPRPALQEAGEGDVTPQLTFFPVHRLIRN